MSADSKCNPAACKNVEATLRTSDDKLHSLFDYVNDGLLILDQGGHIRDINRTAYERLGYTKENVLGRHISQLNDPKYNPLLADRFALVNAQGHAMFESAHLHKNGSVLPVEVNIRTIELNGQPMFFSVVRDITERKKTERALLMMQLSIDNMGDGAFWLTPDGRVAYANEAACHALGYTQQEMLNLRVFDFDPATNADIWPSHWENLRKMGSRTIESTHRSKHGKSIPVEITVNHVCYEDEEYHCTFVRDISKRKQQQRALKMMQFSMDNMSDATFWSAADGRVAYANIAACRSLGYTLDEMLALRVCDIDPQMPAEAWAVHWQELKAIRSVTIESTHRAKDGRIFPVEVSVNYMQCEGEEYLCAFVRDITSRKLNEEKVARLAHFDALTGLPNRTLLYDRLEQAIAQANRQKQRIAVLFLDLDGFKEVNDSHGHHVGDALLKAVAQRLSENVRDMDTVARVGGDEFIFILNAIDQAENAAIVARKVIASLARHFVIQDKTCQIGGSIGIAIFPEDAGDMEDIIKQADDAMYLAKNNGKGNYQFARRDPAL